MTLVGQSQAMCQKVSSSIKILLHHLGLDKKKKKEENEGSMTFFMTSQSCDEGGTSNNIFFVFVRINARKSSCPGILTTELNIQTSYGKMAYL